MSMDCRQYQFYKGAPCDICGMMHDTKMHIKRSDSRDHTRQYSRDGKGRNTYHIPDFKYRDQGDSVYAIALEPKVTRENEHENIFKAKNN